MSTHSFEVPAAEIPIDEPLNEVVEKIDAGHVNTFRQVPIPASLVESFLADPSVVIEGFEDIVPESSSIRDNTEGIYQIGYVPTGNNGEKRQISATLLGPSGLSRAIRRAKSLVRPQLELPYTVQIEPANMPVEARQLDLFKS